MSVGKTIPFTRRPFQGSPMDWVRAWEAEVQMRQEQSVVTVPKRVKNQRRRALGRWRPADLMPHNNRLADRSRMSLLRSGFTFVYASSDLLSYGGALHRQGETSMGAPPMEHPAARRAS